MISFGLLIIARWFGLTSPSISETEALKLWEIVQWGIGGGVIGRSLEKTVPIIASTLAVKTSTTKE